jgi:hypothetical protein
VFGIIVATDRCKAGFVTESHSCAEWRITGRCRDVLLGEIIWQDKIKLNNMEISFADGTLTKPDYPISLLVP